MSDKRPKPWSVLTYDLKTAIDVCGIPCLLKTSSRTLPDEALLPIATKIKIESEVVLYSAHVRVIDYDDPDWIIYTKGRDFYDDRCQFLGCELLLPLSYTGLVRLCQKRKPRSYFNITEVAEDFPRLVRVEEDTACASPGETKPQALKKGTLLQTDRLTKSTKMIRGMSETFLMFFEVGTGKEYGFPLMCAIHFTEVEDTFKYTLKEVIDQLPLPRRVQFVSVNPYDIILSDDEEALDLITILDGPIEIIGIRRLEMLVGLCLDHDTRKYEMVAIPKDDSILDDIRVHLPSKTLCDNDISFMDKEMPSRAKRDLLRTKLYAFYVDDLMPVFLNNEDNKQDYDFIDTTIPPPLPPRHYGNPSLPTAHSDTHINDPERCSFIRRRFKSLGDVTSNSFKRLYVGEGNGIRGFLSSMSRRLRHRRGSVDITIDVQESVDVSLLDRFNSFKQSLGRRTSIENSEKSPATFVCYLNNIEETNVENVSETASITRNDSGTVNENTRTVINESSADESTETMLQDRSFVRLDDNLSLTSNECNNDNIRNEIIYASVNWKSKERGIVEVRERFCCDICKTAFLSTSTGSEC